MDYKFSITFLLLTMMLTCSYVLKSNQEEEAYYIFSDQWVHGIPTGFMGEKNGTSLKLDDACMDHPFKGDKCVKFSVDNSESWRGLYIQFTGSWNVALDDKTVLADLSAYDKLEFYARAETKDGSVYVIPEIGVGGGGGSEDKRTETFMEIDKDWKKYSVSLKGMDLKRVNSLFFMTFPVGTLYLDEIRFVKSKRKK